MNVDYVREYVDALKDKAPKRAKVGRRLGFAALAVRAKARHAADPRSKRRVLGPASAYERLAAEIEQAEMEASPGASPTGLTRARWQDHWQKADRGLPVQNSSFAQVAIG